MQDLADAEERNTYTFLDNLKRILGETRMRARFLSSLAAVLVLSLVIPHAFGLSSLSGIFYYGENIAWIKREVTAKAIAIPMAMFFAFLGKTSAHKWWIVAGENEKKTYANMKNPAGSLLLKVLKLTVVFSFIFYLLPLFMLIIVSFILTAKEIRLDTIFYFVLLIAMLVIPYNIYVYVYALVSRCKFLKKLSVLASDEGWRITDTTDRYSSVFSRSRMARFELKKENRRFSVALMSFPKRRAYTYVNDNGTVTVKRTFGLFKLELFHLLTDIPYYFEGEEGSVKLIVFSPCPKRLFFNLDSNSAAAPGSTDARSYVKGQSRAFDGHRVKRFSSGDKFGDYKFYTPEGFISAMDNDCLHREA